MWNPLRWFCKTKLPEPPSPPKDGEDARRARREAEHHLVEARRQSEEVNRLVRRTPKMRTDHFAEDLRKAFGAQA